MKYIDDKELIAKMKHMDLSPDQKSIVDEAIHLLGYRQAHIDMLMGEWEPEEMSKEQFDNWASHQRRVPEESLPAGLRLTATKEERQAWLRSPLTVEQETALVKEEKKFSSQMEEIIEEAYNASDIDYLDVSRRLREAIVENEVAKNAIKQGE